MLLLNPRVWIALALSGLLAFTHLTVYRSGRHAVQAKWDEAKVVQERQAQAQATRNRELQRVAELHYTVAAQGQTRYITRITQEVHDAAAPLSACPVPVNAVRLLNAAAACARGDSPVSCGHGDEVPGSR